MNTQRCATSVYWRGNMKNRPRSPSVKGQSSLLQENRRKMWRNRTSNCFIYLPTVTQLDCVWGGLRTTRLRMFGFCHGFVLFWWQKERGWVDLSCRWLEAVLPGLIYEGDGSIFSCNTASFPEDLLIEVSPLKNHWVKLIYYVAYFWFPPGQSLQNTYEREDHALERVK